MIQSANSHRFVMACGLLLIFAITPPAMPQAATETDSSSAPFKQEELDQMLAPLALYPDSLLSQILMASTYPIELVQADRWIKANPDLKGDALAKELEAKEWDPSVKSLVNFPEVLASLSDKLDWTVKIGDAFIADQKRVLDTVQKLRGKAYENNNLQSNDHQTVTVEQADTPNQTIIIESSSPDVVYVPAYNPTVVYGAWWYPAYPPPVYYYPPYYTPGPVISFGLGFACGAAWGYAWGDCDWHGGDVDIDIDQNFDFNRNIDRSKYVDQRQRDGRGNRDGKGKWQHDPQHRKGVSYRDQSTANRFGGASSRDAVQARENYRGRAETGRQELARSGAEARPRTGQTGRSDTPVRTQSRDASAGMRDRSNSGGRTSAFDSSRQSGSAARSASQRGQVSRSSSPSYQGSRGGRAGGGSRGGGGRGGGGRGRR